MFEQADLNEIPERWERLDRELTYDYRFNPEEDELLMTGAELKEGMAVIIEDWSSRVETHGVTANSSRFERARQRNRFCIVGRIDRDTYDSIVRFVATYGDGTKSVYMADLVSSWIVKKWSMT